MARGGFFAGLQRAARVAARENERRARQSAREHAALGRRVKQTRKAESRAQTQLAKADAAHRKLRKREAQEAHDEATLAEVEERNQQLAEVYEDIDTLLEATLFGYEKGAFTGAAKATPGYFEEAHGSTLLLAQLDRTAKQFTSVRHTLYSLNGNRQAFYEWLQLATP